MKPIFIFRMFTILSAISFSIYTNDLHASGAKRPEVPEEAVSGNENDSTPVTGAPEIIAVRPPASPDAETETELAEKYSHIDPEGLINPKHLKDALLFYDINQKIIKNKRYMVVIDFKLHNSKKRFYLIDMDSGDVEPYLTAHGKNSDPDFDGYATKFSNTSGSLMTSLGFYLTAETYFGEHDYSLRLDGLSSTNSNARARAIVIHGATYVRNLPLIGRSYGCPALEEGETISVIDMIKKGALMYAAY